jgi:maltose alpha-D-glucosyltransferase/alpha-amylase
MERIIRMRKEIPEIGWGDYAVLRTGTPEALAIRYDWRNNSVIFIHSMVSVPREIVLETGLTHDGSAHLVNLLSSDHSVAGKTGKHRILLEPYGYRWYRVGVLDNLLNCAKI